MNEFIELLSNNKDMSCVMEDIGIGELRSRINPLADQCLKCFALYIKSIITLILKQFQASSNQQPGLCCIW